MSKPAAVLMNWSTTSHGDPYTAPECRRLTVQGNVFGHPDFEDGDHVVTGTLIGADALRVETRRSIYVLEGPPDPKFVQFCEVNNIPFNPENPIRVR